jgi:hypothetical protein
VPDSFVHNLVRKEIGFKKNGSDKAAGRASGLSGRSGGGGTGACALDDAAGPHGTQRLVVRRPNTPIPSIKNGELLPERPRAIHAQRGT